MTIVDPTIEEVARSPAECPAALLEEAIQALEAGETWALRGICRRLRAAAAEGRISTTAAKMIRAAALEEAAKVAEDDVLTLVNKHKIAAAIRAMRDAAIQKSGSGL